MVRACGCAPGAGARAERVRAAPDEAERFLFPLSTSTRSSLLRRVLLVEERSNERAARLTIVYNIEYCCKYYAV